MAKKYGLFNERITAITKRIEEGMEAVARGIVDYELERARGIRSGSVEDWNTGERGPREMCMSAKYLRAARAADFWGLAELRDEIQKEAREAGAAFRLRDAVVAPVPADHFRGLMAAANASEGEERAGHLLAAARYVKSLRSDGAFVNFAKSLVSQHLKSRNPVSVSDFVPLVELSTVFGLGDTAQLVQGAVDSYRELGFIAKRKNRAHMVTLAALCEVQKCEVITCKRTEVKRKNSIEHVDTWFISRLPGLARGAVETLYLAVNKRDLSSWHTLRGDCPANGTRFKRRHFQFPYWEKVCREMKFSYGWAPNPDFNHHRNLSDMYPDIYK